jgi:hypothetical protein
MLALVIIEVNIMAHFFFVCNGRGKREAAKRPMAMSVPTDKQAMLHAWVCLPLRIALAYGLGHIPLWAAPYAATAMAAIAIGFTYTMTLVQGQKSVLNTISDRSTKWWRNWRWVHATLWAAAAIAAWPPWVDEKKTGRHLRRRSLGFASAILLVDASASIVAKQWVRHPDPDPSK